MPAPETMPWTIDGRPALGHVNLMVDTLIANANVEDLRSIVRGLLATSPPTLAAAFTTTARTRLCQTHSKVVIKPQSLFNPSPARPTQHLRDTLKRARSLYGAGLGFASLHILTSIVRASVGLRWAADSELVDILTIIDSDISQAIQSSKEETEAGLVNDYEHARTTVKDLRKAVDESLADVRAWGGEFPFERATASLDVWKV